MIDVFIGGLGTMVAIHSDELVKAATEVCGQVGIRRASHVDQYCDLCDQAKRQMALANTPIVANGWYADMSPLGGPVLGPFEDRQAALAAEHDLLIAQGIPRLLTTSGPLTSW